ncbi:hypothetical protein EV13_0307 [Prochlorococcus sp. MIT 0702]|nr:hypothetical protein EV12_1303 [Prochlorococcus sp. MIT 0701]KGG30430.1 hypothetical protein EV13_0307 [Prochlorococcus sp. MIT 0702]KGG36520.1 hypothetical protein EV14_0252 [Prochlorococcus sp. MIT 0703]
MQLLPALGLFLLFQLPLLLLQLVEPSVQLIKVRHEMFARHCN